MVRPSPRPKERHPIVTKALLVRLDVKQGQEGAIEDFLVLWLAEAADLAGRRQGWARGDGQSLRPANGSTRAVDVSAMLNAVHCHGAGIVIDLVDHAVVGSPGGP